MILVLYFDLLGIPSILLFNKELNFYSQKVSYFIRVLKYLLYLQQLTVHINHTVIKSII